MSTVCERSSIVRQIGILVIALLFSSTAIAGHLAPNDPLFPNQLAFNNSGTGGGVPDADIDMTEVWATVLPFGKIAVASLDTGVEYTHEDLYLNIWINQDEIPPGLMASLVDTDGDGWITFWDLNNPVNFFCVFDHNGNSRIDAGDILADPEWEDGIDQDANSYVDDLVGWDFYDNDNDPMHGGTGTTHGTNTASVIGAITNNGVGVAGICWNRALIIPVRFEMNTSIFQPEDAVAAINYAVTKAPISSNSWTNDVDYPEVEAAIIAAGEAGHLFVFAAGNQSRNIDLPGLERYPGSYNIGTALSIGGTDGSDNLVAFSNYGLLGVDLSAPVTNTMAALGNSYLTSSGTSFATPIVAGAAALFRLAHPEMTNAEIKMCLYSSVDLLPTLIGKSETGGRINVARAFNIVSSAIVKTHSPSGELFINSLQSVRIAFGNGISPATFTASDVTLNGPGGSIPVSSVVPVPNTDYREFDIVCASQTAAGTYTITVGPNIANSVGELMDQDADGFYGEATDDRYTGSFSIVKVKTFASIDVPKTVIDKGTIYSGLSLASSVVISRVTVQLNISHNRDDNLDVYLKSPAGTKVELFTDVGGSGKNFTNTILDQLASVAIKSGTAPFSGIYRPEGNLGDFAGQNASGTWQLQVTDDTRLYTGTLSSWSVTVYLQ